MATQENVLATHMNNHSGADSSSLCLVLHAASPLDVSGATTEPHIGTQHNSLGIACVQCCARPRYFAYRTCRAVSLTGNFVCTWITCCPCPAWPEVLTFPAVIRSAPERITAGKGVRASSCP